MPRDADEGDTLRSLNGQHPNVTVNGLHSGNSALEVGAGIEGRIETFPATQLKAQFHLDGPWN